MHQQPFVAAASSSNNNHKKYEHFRFMSHKKKKRMKIVCRSYHDIIENLTAKQNKYLRGIKGFIEFCNNKNEKDECIDLNERIIFVDVINSYMSRSNVYEMKISNKYIDWSLKYISHIALTDETDYFDNAIDKYCNMLLKKEDISKDFKFAIALFILRKLHQDVQCPSDIHNKFWKAHCTYTMGNFIAILARIQMFRNIRKKLMIVIKTIAMFPAPGDSGKCVPFRLKTTNLKDTDQEVIDDLEYHRDMSHTTNMYSNNTDTEDVNIRRVSGFVPKDTMVQVSEKHSIEFSKNVDRVRRQSRITLHMNKMMGNSDPECEQMQFQSELSSNGKNNASDATIQRPVPLAMSPIRSHVQNRVDCNQSPPLYHKHGIDVKLFPITIPECTPAPTRSKSPLSVGAAIHKRISPTNKDNNSVGRNEIVSNPKSITIRTFGDQQCVSSKDIEYYLSKQIHTNVRKSTDTSAVNATAHDTREVQDYWLKLGKLVEAQAKVVDLRFSFNSAGVLHWYLKVLPWSAHWFQFNGILTLSTTISKYVLEQEKIRNKPANELGASTNAAHRLIAGNGNSDGCGNASDVRIAMPIPVPPNAIRSSFPRRIPASAPSFNNNEIV